MIAIERIRIKNFRSIVDETIDLNDINFFVGKNDSGKSNVLKALNLFFNDETDFGREFDFNIDYSKFAKVVNKRAKEITISLDVVIPNTYSESGVKTWTKIWRCDGLHYDNIESLFKPRSKFITYLKRIKYFYIPAIKSNEYFRYLLSQVYLSMTQTADTTLEELNENYSYSLQGLTQRLTLQLRDTLNMTSSVQMPRNLNVLFRDLTFSTSDKYVDNIDLNQRGDGIKARHIPAIIRFMQENTEKGRPKKSIIGSYIWGFEEPENGVEYLSCFEMADELCSYAVFCQMLITTHSPAFYLKSDSSQSARYFVYKCEDGKSKYDKDSDINVINEKIGFLPLISPYIQQEHKKYLAREATLKEEIKNLNDKYERLSDKVVIITEGKTDVKHIKFAFEQLGLNASVLERIEYYDFTSGDTLGDELSILLNRLSKIPKTNMVIGILDRDKHPVQNDKGKLYKTFGQNVYAFNIPALNNDERNTDDKICIEHYYSNDEIEVNTDMGHLYMGKDFNEYGLSLDGLFCFQNYAKNNSITPISIIDASNKHIQKLSNVSKIISKDDFADYVINHPEEFNFKNFEKIFYIISKIIEDNS
ncbi:AAA family ATPase [Eubacterium coprostanoligenes]|uniref:ATP-dependent nuclease n=1 Tax=Eubacterium coprostanoligenes TaxID=290054 RepID=UPI002A8155EB|nr:AAA family ATPase [Eubacterium coprostanoligenes]MDY4698637.1 AAA family ATPase [Eubacterium coprostanoligenes]